MTIVFFLLFAVLLIVAIAGESVTFFICALVCLAAGSILHALKKVIQNVQRAELNNWTVNKAILDELRAPGKAHPDATRKIDFEHLK